MKSKIYLLTTILISFYLKSEESAVFCDAGTQTKVDRVFNMNDDIYLVRNQDVWISNYKVKNGIPDPTSFKIEEKFKGLDLNILRTGFAVEVVPENDNSESCDKSSNSEHCWFNEYMLNTGFIFYQKQSGGHVSKQMYSMVKWDPNSLTFSFDNQIGGYGYMLRANNTVGRSNWPGITKGNDQILATLFVRKIPQIVLFIKSEDNKTFMVKKLLKDEWNVKVNPIQIDYGLGDHPISAFRKRNEYFLVKENEVYKFKDLVYSQPRNLSGFDKTNETVAAFFKCLS